MSEVAISKSPPPGGYPEVLTLDEAAAYLRLPQSEVLRLVKEQGLPGRSAGNEWRFLKAALADWLRKPDQHTLLERQFGALRDDPHLKEMLEQVYRDRGRPTAEE